MTCLVRIQGHCQVVVGSADGFNDRQAAQIAVTRSTQPVALVELLSQRIQAVSEHLLSLLGASRGQLLGHRVEEFVAQEPTGAIALIAAGRLDGAQATRILAGPTGEFRPVQAWAHALGRQRPPRYAIILLIDDAAQREAQPPRPLRVYGVVDESWRLDHLSSNVLDVLGYSADDMVGVLLTSLVHGHDMPEILAGLASAEHTQMQTLVRVRVMDAEQRWRWFQMRIGPLTRPPGFGFVLRALAETPPDPTAGLHEFLARVGGETLADVTLMPGPLMPTSLQLPALARLSSRQWEILVRVNTGAAEHQIATALRLDPVVLRRHMADIFDVLGVQGTQELAELLETAARLPEDRLRRA
jgi:PAS domain-containing protein/DNA-binding CsgD family transcriptional regulator